MKTEDIWNQEQEFLRKFQNFELPQGGLSNDDFIELHSLVATHAYDNAHNIDRIRIADVGCWTGTSSVLFSQIAKENNGKVFSIDWFRGSETSNLVDAARYFNIKQVFLDNISQFDSSNCIEVLEMTSLEAVKRIPDESLDVVFIDADHRYRFVTEDIVVWYPKVKIGGLICGHDCDMLLPKGLESLKEVFKDQDVTGVFHIGVSLALAELFGENVKKTHPGVIWFHSKRTPDITRI